MVFTLRARLLRGKKAESGSCVAMLSTGEGHVMDEELRRVTLFELEILGELAQHDSLRSLCRAKQLDAPHLSKILARTEKKLGIAVLKRSPKGYLLTPEGQRVVHFAREISRASAVLKGAPTESPLRTLTIAAPRFVAACLVAPALEAIRSRLKGVRFRLLDVAPDEVASAAVSSAAELLVTVGTVDLPRTWEARDVGTLSWGLYASRRHPLPVRVTGKQAAEYPFVVPTYWSGKAFDAGNDHCPLPWSQRRRGDESSSILTAVEIVRRSAEQLVFAPRIVMEEFRDAQGLRRIHVSDWEPVTRPVTLYAHADRVAAPFFEALHGALAPLAR